MPVNHPLHVAPQVTDYLPRLWLFMLGFPRILEQLLEYTFKVSAALALINMAPVIHLDGQAALDALLRALGNCLSSISNETRVAMLAAI